MGPWLNNYVSIVLITKGTSGIIFNVLSIYWATTCEALNGQQGLKHKENTVPS